MAQWETLRVLPVVKAYPEASKKYRTTVCVAAVTIPDGRWVRLYPIRFTAYTESKRFKKYQPFEVRAARNESDSRPESYRIDEDTIRISGPVVDTKDDWSEHKRLLYNARVSSLCELQRRQRVERKSLGMIRVKQVTGSHGRGRRREVSRGERSALVCSEPGPFQRGEASSRGATLQISVRLLLCGSHMPRAQLLRSRLGGVRAPPTHGGTMGSE